MSAHHFLVGHVHRGDAADNVLLHLEKMVEDRDDVAEKRFAGLSRAGRDDFFPPAAVDFTQPESGMGQNIEVEKFPFMRSARQSNLLHGKLLHRPDFPGEAILRRLNPVA